MAYDGFSCVALPIFYVVGLIQHNSKKAGLMEQAFFLEDACFSFKASLLLTINRFKDRVYILVDVTSNERKLTRC